ncbi:MAG: hypothetical protein ACRD27_04900, partial [Terracidiphilus sp.]
AYWRGQLFFWPRGQPSKQCGPHYEILLHSEPEPHFYSAKRDKAATGSGHISSGAALRWSSICAESKFLIVT